MVLRHIVQRNNDLGALLQCVSNEFNRKESLPRENRCPATILCAEKCHADKRQTKNRSIIVLT